MGKPAILDTGTEAQRADALLHIRRAMDIREWREPECSRVNGRVCAEWEAGLVFDARMRERTAELVILRGIR